MNNEMNGINMTKEDMSCGVNHGKKIKSDTQKENKNNGESEASGRSG